MAQKKSTFWNMLLTLSGIALVAAFLLSFVEGQTKDAIDKAKTNRELEALAAVVKPFDNNPFAEKLSLPIPHKKEKLELYPARKNGVVNSYAIKTYSDKGFAGRIEMIVGFFMDGRINNFVITQSQETPGLGTKINDEKFKAQFHGLYPGRTVLKVRQDGGEIDAVTAATISSRAAVDAIRRAIDAYHNFYTGNK